MIGGLLTYDENEIERKLPLLGDIPLVRPMFRWKQKTRNETELLFVISPYIIGRELKDVKMPGLKSRMQIPLEAQAKPLRVLPDAIPENWQRKYLKSGALK